MILIQYFILKMSNLNMQRAHLPWFGCEREVKSKYTFFNANDDLLYIYIPLELQSS